jgi:predicted helicase
MVDKVLKEDFNISDGIASNEKIEYKHEVDPYFKGNAGKKIYRERTDVIPKVQILDPAVGTATFLNETVKYIYENKFEKNAGAWPSYVNENILPRLNGFELMMTPYTIAHLKLGMTLSELGAKKLNDRLRIFLTNTLAEGEEKELPLFAFGLQKVVTEESNYASEVKNGLPVMVVIGNPPYSGVSSNETKYANSLIEKYKVEPGGGQKLQERKHWLNDDYVKFIAFAEDMVTKNGKGIVAMITNNGYIDNPTFRGMRWKLASSFDKIYILNLHGNAKKREVAPDGTKDENVFDIMQGVSIMIAVKTSTSQKLANVYYSELYGLRKNKFKALNDGDINYKKINTLDSKMMYFVPKSNDGREGYERGIPLNELMPVNTTGIVTMGDNFIVAEKPEIIADRVKKLADGYYDEEKLESFGLGKNYAKYVLENQPTLKYDDAKIVELAYRPFDKRFTYYDNKVIWRWREKVMRNFLGERSEPHTHTHRGGSR